MFKGVVLGALVANDFSFKCTNSDEIDVQIGINRWAFWDEIDVQIGFGFPQMYKLG